MTVVLLHPIGLDADCWQFMDLTSIQDVQPYSMLWHGGRSEPSERLTLDSMARDVLDAFDGPLDLVGVSMGGAVVLKAALQYPSRVRSGLIACSSAGGGNSVAQHQRAAAVREGGMAAVLEDTLARWFSPAALADSEDDGVKYVRERLLTDDPRAFEAGWLALAENNALPRLGELQMPVTVVHARDDAAGPLSVRAEIAAALPVSRLEVLPGPHMIMIEQPVEFADAISRHLDWVGSLD